MIESYLERLFTRGSLENTERGVEFELKNRLIETEFTGLHTVRLDDERVSAEDISLELDDGTRVAAEDITPEDPLRFDLADTARVVAETERLALGRHTVGMTFGVEGYGRVSFETDGEVTEEDLVGADVSAMGEDEAVGLIEEVREPTTLRGMLEDAGRDAVADAVEDQLGEVSHIEERRGIVDEGTAVDRAIEDRLAAVFDGGRRLAVYAALRRTGGGGVEDVARETGMRPSSVESVLEGMETDGSVEYDYEEGVYTAPAPSELALEGCRGIVETLRRSLE